MLRKVYLSLAFILFFAALFLAVDHVYHHQSSHFSLNRIRNSNLFSSEWETPLLSDQEMKELRNILNQKFVLYNKGFRSYVCVSEDGKYILKFFKHQQLNPKSWLGKIAFSWNPYYQEFLSKKRRYEEILYNSKAAFLYLKEETGLIYLHANNTQVLDKKVLILDKNDKEHIIDLDKTIFCVQAHPSLLYLRIAELMHDKEIEGAKAIISSIFSLIDRLGRKGVINDAFCSDFNFGLVQDKAIQVSIGELYIDPVQGKSLDYKNKIHLMTARLKTWLDKEYPELCEHFDACLDEAMKKPD